MTAKKTLIHLGESPSLAASDFWRARLSEHFNFFSINYGDDLSSYNKKDYVIWTSHLEPEWYKQWADQGFKVVYDKLWDHFGSASIMEPNVLLFLTDNFIFVNEVLKYKWLGIDKKVLEKSQPDKFFLCLMNADRPHRTELYDRIQKYNQDSLISYVAKDVYVEGDTDHKTNSAWHSYFNPEWYTRTYFSLVAETSVQTIGHMSEKMFKPFAFKHPMILWASQNNLDCAKRLGFETFNFIFNEHYDTLPDNNDRLDSIMKLVDNYSDLFKNNKELMNETFINSPRTQEVLNHNHNLFYSEELLSRLITKEFINPLMEFIDA